MTRPRFNSNSLSRRFTPRSWFVLIAGVLMVGVMVAGPFFARATEAKHVSLAPGSCSGWDNADKARHIDQGALAPANSFSPKNSAVFQYAPANSSGSPSVQQGDITCRDFHGSGLKSDATVVGAAVRLSLAGLASVESDDVLVPSYSLDEGQTWVTMPTILVRGSVSNRLHDGYWKLALPSGLTGGDLQRLQLRLHYADAQSFSSTTLFVDGATIEVDVAPPVENTGGLKRFLSITDEPIIVLDQHSLQNVEILSPDGIPLGDQVVTQLGSERSTVSFRKGVAIRPGTYIVRTTSKNFFRTSVTEQAISIGEVSVNTNKPVYGVGELVHLAMGTVDALGKTRCDANLTLRVTKPGGQIALLTTGDGSITHSSQCGADSVTNVPDYSATLIADQAGDYRVALDVATDRGPIQVTQTFRVTDGAYAVIERLGPTRINPRVPYVERFQVTPTSDFQGTFEERLPLGFELSNISAGGQVTTENDEQVIRWDVAWSTGRMATLEYTFNAPDQEPAVFELGPARFGETSEGRSWAVTSDTLVRREKAGMTFEPVNLTRKDFEPEQQTLVEPTKLSFRSTENAHIKVFKEGFHLPAGINVAGLNAKKAITVTNVTIGHQEQPNLITALRASEEVRRDTQDIEVLHLVPTASFRPGRYVITTTLTDGTATTTQTSSFDWGVLAINTNQSAYRPNETATISMAALDGRGNTVCDASLTLTVTSPEHLSTTFSSAAGTIAQSKECGPNTVTNIPDYVATYTPTTSGTYVMALTGVVNGRTLTTSDSFTVESDLPYTLIREAPIRVYPAAQYDFALRVLPHQDYRGEVVESVPATYNVISVGEGGRTETKDNITTIRWNVNWKAGVEAVLLYRLDPEDVSPYLFSLGPVRIGNFVERRQWQIASDATVTISGNFYSNEGTSAFDCSAANKTMTLKVNGAGSYSATCTANTGAYSIASVTAVSGDIISVYVDGASEKAVHVLRSNATTQSNVHLYQNRVIARSDSGTITNANLGQFDSDNDADIQFSSNANALVVASGSELHIWSSTTYLPGGTVTTNATGGDFHVDDSATATIDTATSTIGTNIAVDTGATLNINSTLAVTGGGIVTSGTGIVASSGSSTTLNGSGAVGGGSGTVTFYNLIISGGTTTVDSDVTISNNIQVDISKILSISSGKNVSWGGNTITLNGTISGAGRFIHSSNTAVPTGGTISSIFRLDVSAASRTFAVRTYGGQVECYSNSVSLRNCNTGAGTTTFSSNLYIIADGTANVQFIGDVNNPTVNVTGDIDFTGTGSGTEVMNAGSGTWTVSGNIDFTAGTFAKGTGTIVMDGASKAFTTAGQSLQNFTANGTTTINDSTTLVRALTVNDGKTLTLASGATLTMDFSAASPAFSLSTSGTVTGAGRLTIKNSAGTAITTSGTISSIFRLDVSGGTNSFPVRTWGGPVECYSNTASTRVCRVGTAGSQTVTFSSDVTVIADGTAGPQFNASTWNNIANIGGSLSCIKNSSGTPAVLTATVGFTVSGSVDFTNCAFTAASGNTFTMNGTGNLIGAGQTFINLKIDGSGNTVSVITSDVIVSTTLTIGGAADGNDDTLSIASGRTVTSTSAGTVTLTGSGTDSITGAGTLVMQNSNLGTGGTLSSVTRLDVSATSLTMPVRTYGGAVQCYSNSTASNRNCNTNAGTYTFQSDVTVINDGSFVPSIIGSTNNPTVNITGNLGFTKNSSGTPAIATGTGTWTVSGNADFTNGTMTATANNTFAMNGTGGKTLVGASASLYNLTVSSSSDTITLQTTGLTVTNTVNIASTSTLSIASGITLTHSGATLTLTGTISGAGTYAYQSTTAFPTTGTISSILRMDSTNGNQIVGARTYGGAVELYNNSAVSARTITLGTAGSQTLTFSSSLSLNAANTQNLTIQGATWDPTVNVTGNFQVTGVGAGTEVVTAPDAAATWTVTGNVDLTNGTWTASAETLKMDGTANLIAAGQAFKNLTIDGNGNTVTVTTSDVTVSGTVTIGGAADGNNDTLSIASGRTLTSDTAGTVTLVGSGTDSITGAGTLTIDNSNLGTAGTISSIVRFDSTNGDLTMPNRTYGGAVEIYNNHAATARVITMAVGTHTLSGNVTVIANNGGNVTMAGATNNPTVNLTGDLAFTTNSTGTVTLTSGTGTWTVSGNVNFTNGTFTAASGNTLVMNGSGKTLTSAAQTLQNVTLSGIITLANATHTIAGNLDMTGGTITAGSSTVTMTGTSNTITGASQTLNNLTIDPASTGTITLQTSNVSVNGTLSVASGDTLSIILRTLTMGAGSTVTISGTISGTGSLYLYTSNLDTNGTLTVSTTTFDCSLGNLTMPARSFASVTTMNNDGGSACTVTPSAGTHTLTGSLLVSAGATDAVTFVGATNNPTMNIAGSVSYFSVGAVMTISTGTGTWTVSTSLTLTGGTFTATTGNTVVMDGTGTIASGGNSLYNFTVNGNGNTVSVATADLAVSSTLTVGGAADGNNDTLSINLTRNVTSGPSGTVTIQGSGTDSITGAGTLTVQHSNLSSNGTLSSEVIFDDTNGAITMPARTYGAAVTVTNTGSTDRTVTAGVGTLAFASTLTTSKSGSGAQTLQLDTNDPTTTVTGTLTIGSGTTLQAPSANGLNINGNYANNGTFTHNSGTVTLAGSAQQTLSGTMTSGSAFNALTITNASGSDPDSSPSVIFSTAATTAGTFTAVTPDTKIRFGATLVYTLTNIVFNGQATGTRVYVRSSSGGSAWLLTASGTRSVSYTNVKDSNATGSGTAIDASNGTNVDGTGNTNWTFVAGITISGVIRQTDESTPYDCSAGSLTIHISINGGANSNGTCTLNTGVYSIATAEQPSSAGDPIVVSIDSGATPKATAVTLAADTTSAITNLDLYQSRLIVTYENAGPMTNAKLATGDNADAGIRYSVSGNNLTVETGIELHVKTGKTFTPGGTVTTQGSGNLHVDDSATTTLGTATNAIDGDLVVDGGATLNINTDTTVAGGDITTSGTSAVVTKTAGTPTLTVSGTGSLGGGTTPTLSFYTLTLSGTPTLASDITVANNLTLPASVTAGSTTVTMTGTSAALVGGGSTITNLTINPSSAGTVTLQTSDVTVSNILTVATGDTLSLGVSRTLNLSSTSGTLTLDGTISGSGTLSYAPTSTFPTSGTISSPLQMNATGGSQTLGARTYGSTVEIYNNSASNGRSVELSSGTTTFSSSVTLNAANTQDVTLTGVTNNPTVNISGDVDYTGVGAGTEGIVTGTGTWTVSGNVDFTGGTVTATAGNTLVMNGSGKTLTSAAQTLQNVTLSGTITLANATHTIAGNLDMTGGTITAGSSTVTMTGTSNTITGASQTLNNLTIDPASTGTITLQTSDLKVGTGSTARLLGYWDGGSAPAGWSCQSCGSGDFYQRFLRGAATYGATGGATTHTHSVSWVSSGNNSTSSVSVDSTGSGIAYAVDPHTHDSLTAASTGTGTNLPTYKDIKVIRYDSIGSPTAIPAGFIGMFDTTPPAGWTTLSSYDTKFLYGENDASTTGGATTHTNSVSITSGTASATGTAGANGQNSTIKYATDVHTHTGSGTTASGDQTPPYRDVILAKADADTTVPDGLISMWDGAPPASAGWSSISGASAAFDSKLIRANSSYGGTGGAATHTHSDLAITTSVASGTANSDLVAPDTTVARANHTHSITVSFGTANNTPPYLDVIIGKYSTTNTAGVLTVAAGDTLSIASGRTLTSDAGGTVALSGTISGAGKLTVQNSNLSTGGTLSSIVRLDPTDGNISMPNRTYGGAVELVNTGTTSRTITAAAGTLALSSTLDLSKTSSGTLTFDLDANDPTTTIAGAITIGSGTTLSASSGGAFNINGGYTNNGTFTSNSGTVTLAGSAQQTLAGTMTGGSAFNALTITNASGSDPDTSPSVIFGADASGSTLTAITASTKFRFNAGSTYTFTNISFNGQAAGTRVMLRSSSTGTRWILASSGTHAVSYTDVKDSTATTEIDASDGTNVDSGNNSIQWIFPRLIVSLSANTLSLGTLSAATINKASVTSTVTITGSTGFLSYILYDHALQIDGSNAIADESGGGTIVAGTPEFGGSTDEPSGVDLAATSPACTTGATSSNATALATTAKSFATASGTVTSDITTLCLLATINAAIPAGAYTNTITIVTTGKY